MLSSVGVTKEPNKRKRVTDYKTRKKKTWPNGDSRMDVEMVKKQNVTSY